MITGSTAHSTQQNSKTERYYYHPFQKKIHLIFHMSVNHFSSDFPQTLWWPQTQHHELMDSLSKSTSPSPSPSPAATIPPNFWPNNSQFFNLKNSAPNGLFDLNNNEEEDEEVVVNEEIMNNNSKLEEEEDYRRRGNELVIPKLPLFEKPLTPSDVGKLNRLVIPKQHAEKHFPINGGMNESSSGEKGLLLSFEDELGKPWRFRYSYWNSSQSYVLTKGWSRFVKEKKLDAGDIVQFQRHPIDSQRMFISWRKRRSGGSSGGGGVGGGILQTSSSIQPAVVVASGGGGGGWRPYPVQMQPHHHQHHGPAYPYPPDSSFHAGGGGGGNGGKCSSSSKRGGGVLRLFGVNMECGSLDEAAAAPISDDSGSSAASSNQQGPDPAYHNRYHYYHANYDYTTHPDVNFPRDMSRYQQG